MGGPQGTVKRLAVLGQPIAHSRSPAIHRAALAAVGLEGEWTYEAREVSPDDFAATVRGMPREGFVGANVTVPHKRAALELAERRSEVAREIGAANTLTFAEAEIRADNTDAEGLMAALPTDASDRRALVMGAGGAGRAVVWALLREGAEVSIWNRTEERAATLAAELGGVAVGAGERWLATADWDLIVNSTAVGMGGEDQFAALPVKPESLHSGQTVVDLVYGDAETALIAAARKAGATAVDGLEVLVCQGAASLRIWTGAEPPLEAMRAAARGRAAQ